VPALFFHTTLLLISIVTATCPVLKRFLQSLSVRLHSTSSNCIESTRAVNRGIGASNREIASYTKTDGLGTLESELELRKDSVV